MGKRPGLRIKMNKLINSIKYTLAICLFCSINAMSQQLVVEGDIAGLEDEQVIFVYYNGTDDQADTVRVDAGKFIWTKKVDEAQRIGMLFSGAFVHFFAEEGKILIKGTADSLNSLKISGSTVQDEADDYKKSMLDIEQQQDYISKHYSTASKLEQDSFRTKRSILMRQQDEREKQYVASHPNSILSLYIVADWANDGDYYGAKAMYEQLAKSIQETAQGKRIGQRLVILSRSFLGAKIADFTQNYLNGVPVNFSDFKGKYLLIDFWASWCGPCRAENPNVLKAYRRYKTKNFTIIGVSLDDNKENWQKAILEDKMPWLQVSDLKGFKNEIASYYGIMSIPTTFLLDPEGKIIAKNLRGESLHQKLAELLD
ncbi:TlpA disulfide reductase family protein [Pedobacter rhizosphaerae]|uniref:Thiol-disulfide isomerase or thioredoxin n=1 Tax=Pedobacter rhizosphaerae TaxID=390241 RepID=A0A1H9SSF3_9SPHI|nr:TlpA disulfide reductase family protein [Pedobacter rhizosphaerae]SER87940.1 Thiol-disulfide isomerase or thioredoxin [Pedobacter rhizosphaerae]